MLITVYLFLRDGRRGAAAARATIAALDHWGCEPGVAVHRGGHLVEVLPA